MLLKGNIDHGKYLRYSIVQKNLTIGVVFGTLFPIFAILFEIYRLEAVCTLDNIKTIHLNNKLLFIIDTAPLFLGIFAYCNGVSQAKLELTNRQLDNQVLIDDLSGIHNRLYGQRKLSEMIQTAMKHGEKIGVIFIDLDRFKAFNYNMGHWFGDQLLIAVANRLKDGQQSGEFIARLGSDEFMVLVGEYHTMEDLYSVAKRYAEMFQQPFIVGGRPYSLNMSMGISVFPDSGDDIETLFKNADLALSINKHNKNNTYDIFHDDMLDDANKKFIIEEEMLGALERGEFFLVYQPLINVPSQNIEAAEALIRWNNDILGMVSPMEFITVAEGTNLIVDIGKWVLTEACRQNKQWQEQGLHPIIISVNVSVNQLRYPEFIDTVASVIEETGLDAQYLKLEITETVSIQNIEEVRKILSALKQMNVKLSIDDFGTGYSSLAELKALAVDEIKIDKSFVDDIHISGDISDAVIIESIVTMAKSLNLRVVAEGVESLEQFSILQNANCDYVQGYYFSKPVRAEEFVQLFYKFESS